jgi:hypothetical protein
MEELNEKIEFEKKDKIEIKKNFLEEVRYGKYITYSINGDTAQTATNYGIMFIARHPIEIMRVTETHRTAGTDVGAVTLDVKKASSGVAIASGTSLLSSTFSLKSTADTPVVKEGSNLSSSRTLKENDRIELVVSGTLTDLSDVNVTIYYKETNQGYIR